ncbi:DEAD/DEAH box helicase, putative [Plasmodium ovale curtisi]|uniref:2-methoxy-6-polyprenyl-1,4-benzoquinol methylase, mitochondrial n=2 Tax=Plasmodium ovale curtisi TaxID=864141 RepID=A0A1A8VMD2_PLAOA|nr:DEAD/DEAH box helicase, putative [Plasmodium ovale curtisi]
MCAGENSHPDVSNLEQKITRCSGEQKIDLRSFGTNSDQFSNSEIPSYLVPSCPVLSWLYNFGFQKVTEEIKSKLVYNLFSKVSSKYDLMNDLMSLRLHRCWKDQFVKELDLFLRYHSYNMHKDMSQNNYNTSNENYEMYNKEDNSNGDYSEQGIYPDEEKKKSLDQSSNLLSCKILDLAGGTGDIAFRLLERYKHICLREKKKCNNNYHEYMYDKTWENYIPKIIVCDINSDMIKVGMERAKELHYDKYITWLIENAEHLKSIEDNSIDIITLSFGIRNFTNISIALKEIHRVLKPGGRFLCLEFSKVNSDVINFCYTFYLNNIIPLLGKLVVNSEHPYKYLAESIQTFLSPEELAQLIYQNSFRNVSYATMTCGVVAIHSAYKLV